MTILQSITIFINDLDIEIKNKLLKFADDTKLLVRVDTNRGIESLKEDLLNLEKWSEIWKLPFNYDKCKIMHFGKNNPNTQYDFGGKVLQVVNEEKDLGIFIRDDGKVEYQCNKAAKSANKHIGLICRNLQNKTLENMIILYKTLVEPLYRLLHTGLEAILKKIHVGTTKGAEKIYQKY